MEQLINEFNQIYPTYASRKYVNYTFEEANNLGKSGTLQHLSVYGINGFVIPNGLIKDDSSIFEKAQAKEWLRKDCDGIFLTETEGNKYIHICELKSSYATQPITKAKDQIIGSWLKLHSLMSLLQSYHPEEWQVRGIIASFIPTPEQEAAILRMKESGDEKGKFCYNLQRDGKYPMSEANCKRYFYPLNVPEITIYHVSVPYQTEAFGINFDTLIQ